MERTRHSLKTSGIYQIRSNINGKIYIGCASRFYDRKHDHFKRLKYKKHSSFLLQRSYDKHGVGSLLFEIVEVIQRKERETSVQFKERLLKREQYYIDTLKPEFNICKIAGSCLGVIRTEEFKQNHSGENNVSKRLEVKQKQIEARKRYWETHEHLFGKKNPFYKKTHKKESLDKISKANTGRLKGNQHNAGNKRPHTEEEKQKTRDAWTIEKRKQLAIKSKKSYKDSALFKYNNRNR